MNKMISPGTPSFSGLTAPSAGASRELKPDANGASIDTSSAIEGHPQSHPPATTAERACTRSASTPGNSPAEHQTEHRALRWRQRPRTINRHVTSSPTTAICRPIFTHVSNDRGAMVARHLPQRDQAISQSRWDTPSVRLDGDLPYAGEIVWLTSDQGGRQSGPPATAENENYAATAFVLPASADDGLASFVVRVTDREAWRSAATARWLAVENEGVNQVDRGTVMVVTEGARPVAHFHVTEVRDVG
jgi:hypothetical protein